MSASKRMPLNNDVIIHYTQMETTHNTIAGKRVVGEEGVNDAWHENQMLNSELQSLRTRVKALSETVDALTAKNSLLLAEKAAGQWIASGAAAAAGGDVTGLVQGYLQEIEELRARLLEAEALYQQLKKRQMHVSVGQVGRPGTPDFCQTDFLFYFPLDCEKCISGAGSF